MRREPHRPLTALLTTLTFVFILTYTHGIPDFDITSPGSHCAQVYQKLQCCKNRQDDCTAPFYDTSCYCDEFCDRDKNDDCCPDYWSHCKGEESQPILSCYHKGTYLAKSEDIKDNCNICTCEAFGNSSRVECEKKRCLIEAPLLDEVNSNSYFLGWRADNYSKFWGQTLDKGITLRLGTLNPSKTVYNMHPVARMYDPQALPREFDARQKWPYDIVRIRDQGWCGASWAVSTVDVASDRFAIMSKGAEKSELSAQHLLDCNDRGQRGCEGGYLDKAWQFMRKFGLVNENCYPWTERKGQCKVPKGSTLQSMRCHVAEGTGRKEMYHVGPTYRLGNETDIMQEIMTSGPVQATMKVYQDFFAYKSGVYRHTDAATHHRTGYHSVRIIGWGEEISENGTPVKYWRAANTWGEEWGENGYFRILKGTNECEIETYVLGVWAKVMHLERGNNV